MPPAVLPGNVHQALDFGLSQVLAGAQVRASMVLVAYRHGLRASELVDLRWDQVDFRTATLHVRRVKQGTPSTQPILGVTPAKVSPFPICARNFIQRSERAPPCSRLINDGSVVNLPHAGRFT
jgi:integrase